MIGAGPGFLHSLIDRLAQEFAEGRYRDEAARAKNEFIERAGKVFDDDGELFEARMAAFIEWYLIERPLVDGASSLTPVERALTGSNLRPVDRQALLALHTSRHSLFDVGEVTRDRIELEDLLSGARYHVVERRSTAGFESGQIVEARLLFDGHDVVFGKTFLFHPREVRELILDRIDEALLAGRARADIMFAISRMHLRWYRGKQISAERAYASGVE